MYTISCRMEKAEDIRLYSPFNYKKRKSMAILNIGGHNLPVVIGKSTRGDKKPDWIFDGDGYVAEYQPDSAGGGVDLKEERRKGG